MDPLSWLLAVGGGSLLTIVLAGLFKRATGDTYDWGKRWLWPPAPEPHEVPFDYLPPTIRAEECAWVADPMLVDYQAEGYVKVHHPESGGPCFRRVLDYRGETKLWLLRKPGGH